MKNRLEFFFRKHIETTEKSFIYRSRTKGLQLDSITEIWG